MKAEIIIWKDAHSVDDWTSLEDLEMTAQLVISIGVVVKESPEIVALSAGYGIGPESACTTLMIPVPMITSRDVLIEDVSIFDSGTPSE